MAIDTSIRHRFLAFSAILFLVILVGGGIAFVVSMWQMTRLNAGSEQVKTIEVERIKLEASVNAEIAIALKMADSPIIQAYFADPSDPDLERLAFNEIAGYRRAFASNSVFWVNDVDKKFYSDDAYAFTVDTAAPANYWYLMTLNQTEPYNFNINYNPDLNVTNLWINATVRDSNQKAIGVLGTGIDVTAFVNSMYKDYTGNADMYFFNTEDQITGAKDTSLVAGKITMDQHLGDTGKEIIAMAKNLKPGEFQYFSAPHGEVAVGEVPALGWYITAILPLTLLDAMDSSMTIFFVAMIAVILFIFVIFYLFIAQMLKPMHAMVTTLDKISADWDLTRRLKIQQKDEIGTLGNFFNTTFEKIGGLLKGIKNKAFTLSDTGDELSATMNETSQAINNIDKNIENMRKLVLNQADEVNSSAESMGRIIKGLDDLNGHIAVQVDTVAQSSSAIEQMLANIRSVTETLVKNSANINSLTTSSEEGRKDLQKVSEDIKEIARESEGLLEINSVMQNIASQTNLLSMNAAIEAAHAGESGKGFAVVADEIRKLAENSGVQSKTISAVLKKIKSSVDTIAKSTGIVLERFGTMEQEVEVVSNQETQIRNAMQEQETGSHQILEAVTRLNSVTGEVKNASTDMAATSKEVLKQSGKLQDISSNVAGGMDDMTQSAEMIINAITRVIEISKENKENIDNLSSDIGKFKVD